MTTVLANATELFLVHADKIEQASLTVSQIHKNLGPIAAMGDFIFSYLKHSEYVTDWVIRVAVPAGLVRLGGWGLPASFGRNVALGLGGMNRAIADLWNFETNATFRIWGRRCDSAFTAPGMVDGALQPISYAIRLHSNKTASETVQIRDRRRSK